MRAGLIGHPVAHSLSPLIHRTWYQQQGIKAEYDLYDIAPASLKETLLRWKPDNREGLRGFNVTIPHKQSVMSVLDECDAAAAAIGAVNTIIIEQGKWIGTNTDAWGFSSHLLSVAPEAALSHHAIVLGAGGAARAAIYALKQMNIPRITLLNRTYETARALAEDFSVQVAKIEEASRVFSDATVVVNSTSAGMKNNPPLNLPLAVLPETAILYDMVYIPRDTQFLVDGRARGLTAIGGLGMLLGQAQQAFALWWGVMPEITDELKELLQQELSTRDS
jgi:shikimate dehydrogenase